MLYEPFQRKIDYVTTKAQSLGLPVYKFCGLRTDNEQHDLFIKGREFKDGIWVVTDKTKVVTNADAGYSWHNFGLAADLVFRTDYGWNWSTKMPWEEVGKIGEEIGLEWGGRWGFVDLPHFQYTRGISLHQARNMGMIKLWEYMSNMKEDIK